MLLAVVAVAFLAATARAAPGVHLSLAGAVGHPEARRAVAIVVRATRGGTPLRHGTVTVWIARGRTRRSFATRAEPRGRYRARVVFPSAGRWALGARAGRTRATLGSVQVRRPAVPLTFVWPTSVAVESNRSLLLVENGIGRVLRIDPVTGKTVPVISIVRPYAVVHMQSGSFYLSADKSLLRVDAAGSSTSVAESDEDVGPVAVGPNGDVYFATATRIFRVPGGTGPPVRIAGTGAQGYGGDGGPATAAQISRPHGLAVTADGGLLVSDTGNGRVRRIDLRTGLIETWAHLGAPAGIDIAPDGTVYVVDASAKRVVHLTIDGRPLGSVAHVFGDPYDVKAAGDGSLYVVDTSAAGHLFRVAPDGSTSVVSRRR